MRDRDPFIKGLLLILTERTDLTPAGLAKSAELNDSTLRKQLSGANQSMTVANAQKIAKVLDMDLSTIIALGEHSAGPEIVRLAMAIQAAQQQDREKVHAFLDVSSRSRTGPSDSLDPPVAAQEERG